MVNEYHSPLSNILLWRIHSPKPGSLKMCEGCLPAPQWTPIHPIGSGWEGGGQPYTYHDMYIKWNFRFCKNWAQLWRTYPTIQRHFWLQISFAFVDAGWSSGTLIAPSTTPELAGRVGGISWRQMKLHEATTKMSTEFAYECSATVFH